MCVYISCFYDSGDLLSQWRAYGLQYGYSIEFRREFLQHLSSDGDVHDKDFSLAEVRYGLESATEAVSIAVANIQLARNLGHHAVSARYMALRLVPVLSAVKQPGFREEREWRLVAAYDSSGQDPVKFRTTSIGIVPYVVIPFSRGAIARIRLGPGPGMPARLDTVRRLLRSYDYEVEVVASDIPFRV